METPELFIYILKLENQCYFIYCSQNRSHVDIYQECILSFDFVNQNRPLAIIDVRPMENVHDIDHYTKRYMVVYNINNVRGCGNYEHLVLRPNSSILLDHVSLDINNVLDYSVFIQELREQYTTTTHIDVVRDTLQKSERWLSRYYEAKENYTHRAYLKTNKGELKVDDHLFFTIHLLVDIIRKNDTIVSDENRELYQDIIEILKQIARHYHEVEEMEGDLNHYLNCPETIFDVILYSTATSLDKYILEETKIVANEIFTAFENMINRLINYIDALEFDLAAYPGFYERRMRTTIRYLQELEEISIMSDVIV